MLYKPEVVISAALTLRIKELRGLKGKRDPMTEKDDTLSGLNVYITLVLVSTFGCLQELRRILGIPRFPRFLSYPNIICKRQS